MPAGFPSQFWDAEKNAPKLDDLSRDYTRLAKEATDRAAALSTLPAKPEEYKAELPKEFKLPEGLPPIQWNPTRLAQAQKLAHELKIDQPTFSKLLTIEAQRLVDEHAALEATHAAEFQKLGERGAERSKAVNNWISVNLTAAQADGLKHIATNAAAFEAIEKLIERANGGSIPSVQPDARPASPQSHAERIWPGGFSATPQAKVG